MTVLRFVPFAQIEDYLSRGWWVVSALGGSHGLYAVLMEAPVCFVKKMGAANGK